MIRYPGDTSSNLFNWKGAMGPQEDRTRQVEGQKGESVDSCGALFFGKNQGAEEYREHSYAMSHALYMASQWARFADLGVRWTASNGLIGEKPGLSRTLFGGAPTFVRTPDAIVREQLSDLFHGGGHVVNSEVKSNTDVSTRETPLGSSYEALVTTATVDKDGALNVPTPSPSKSATPRRRATP
ncbi:hypothetical protein [Streptomyces asiaticus]|uniref:hypothetical protein n=1 Tax=Streptomyces asiaticus TaxID=114695 RepID=UPI00380BF4DB